MFRQNYWSLAAILLCTAECTTYSSDLIIKQAGMTYGEAIGKSGPPATPQQIKAFEDSLKKNLPLDDKHLKEEELNKRLSELVPAEGKVKRASPEQLEALLTDLGGPSSLDSGFTLLMAHCIKMEAEKKKDLDLYRRSRWATLVLGAASASTATVLTGVNDSNNVTISPETHERLRISTLFFSATGVLLSAVYGLVGFEDRIDRSKNDLVAIRRSIGNARAKWPISSSPNIEAERVNILLDMMSNCNSNSISEREIVQARTQSVAKQVLDALSAVDNALAELTKPAVTAVPADETAKNKAKASVEELARVVKSLATSYGGPVGTNLEILLSDLRAAVVGDKIDEAKTKLGNLKTLLNEIRKQTEGVK